jgi:hypothetical protein
LASNKLRSQLHLHSILELVQPLHSPVLHQHSLLSQSSKLLSYQISIPGATIAMLYFLTWFVSFAVLAMLTIHSMLAQILVAASSKEQRGV